MVIYILLEDTYITMHSGPEPVGVAVSDRSVAEHWASESKFRSFSSVEVFETGDELDQHFKTERETREARISGLLSRKTLLNPPITDQAQMTEEHSIHGIERVHKILSGSVCEGDVADKMMSQGKMPVDVSEAMPCDIGCVGDLRYRKKKRT